MNLSISFLVFVALLGNLCTSVLMTSIVSFIQLIQYPLLNHVSSFDFGCYFKKYVTRISWIIYPVMILEILFAFWLAFLPLHSKLQLPVLITYLLLALVAINTFLFQVPMIQKLRFSFDKKLVSKIRLFNWVRFFSSVLRTILLLWIILFII
ncbi:MAG: hypothetical protein Q8904_12140 [Bacteroidota bacterium]|nr:hypothetical protein [Bacteroidota bacterium]